MPVSSPPLSSGALAPATVTLTGDEFIQGSPMSNAAVRLRQIKGAVATIPAVVVGGSMRVLTDENGHWSIDMVPSDNLTPNSIIEVNSPTMGIFRLRVPTAPGLYAAISLRDDSL